MNLAGAQLNRLGASAKISGWRYSQRPEGTVLEQSPLPGTLMQPAGQTIEVIVSKGMELVPNLIGQNYAPALQKFSAENIQIFVTQRQYGEVPAGEILSQNPEAGSSMPRDRRISVSLSLGPERVPQLVGKKVAAARAEFPRLEINPRGPDFSELPLDQITRQIPGAGSKMPENRQIIVVLADGPLVTMPYLIGKWEKDAKAILDKLGYPYHVHYALSAMEEDGAVIDQEPALGISLDDPDYILSITVAGQEPGPIAPEETNSGDGQEIEKEEPTGSTGSENGAVPNSEEKPDGPANAQPFSETQSNAGKESSHPGNEQVMRDGLWILGGLALLAALIGFSLGREPKAGRDIPISNPNNPDLAPTDMVIQAFAQKDLGEQEADEPPNLDVSFQLGMDAGEIQSNLDQKGTGDA